jgi:hypothetical protein
MVLLDPMLNAVNAQYREHDRKGTRPIYIIPKNQNIPAGKQREIFAVNFYDQTGEAQSLTFRRNQTITASAAGTVK